MQFLVEAVTRSVVGGLLGILLGVIGSEPMTARMGWATLVSPTAVVLTFGCSATMGVFLGFYPARKASRLDPNEALRYE